MYTYTSVYSSVFNGESKIEISRVSKRTLVGTGDCGFDCCLDCVSSKSSLSLSLVVIFFRVRECFPTFSCEKFVLGVRFQGLKMEENYESGQGF